MGAKAQICGVVSSPSLLTVQLGSTSLAQRMYHRLCGAGSSLKHQQVHSSAWASGQRKLKRWLQQLLKTQARPQLKAIVSVQMVLEKHSALRSPTVDRDRKIKSRRLVEARQPSSRRQCRIPMVSR